MYIQLQHMTREQLTKLLTLRIAPSEMEMLSRLSEDTGLPMSAWVRQAIRRDYAARYGAEPAKRSRARKR